MPMMTDAWRGHDSRGAHVCDDGYAWIAYSGLPGLEGNTLAFRPSLLLQIMRLELCESLMAVASERPTKAQHAQELEMSIYEASPTKVRDGQQQG